MAAPSDDKRRGRSLLAATMLGASVIVVAVVVAYARPGGGSGAAPMDAATARYVGGSVCAGCHAVEAAAWERSHHAKAMQQSSDGTVLGDFGDADFAYGGITSRFFRKAGS